MGPKLRYPAVQRCHKNCGSSTSDVRTAPACTEHTANSTINNDKVALGVYDAQCRSTPRVTLTRAGRHAYIRAYIHTHIHTNIHTYIHTDMHACVHTYIRAYTCIHMNACSTYPKRLQLADVERSPLILTHSQGMSTKRACHTIIAHIQPHTGPTKVLK